MRTYIIGQMIQLQAKFLFDRHVLTEEQLGDPVIKIQKPDDSIVTISSGISRVSDVYKYNFDTSSYAAGEYSYYWQTDGEYACIAEGSFALRTTDF